MTIYWIVQSDKEDDVIENDPEVFIVLYRYDGERCLAVVDGAPVAFVERS